MASIQTLKSTNASEERMSEDTKKAGGDVLEDFISDAWEVMNPELISRLKCVLTEDMGMSPNDAEGFIQLQRDIRRKRICLKKQNRIVRIGPRNQWIKELSRDIADQMANFVVGTLLSDRTARTRRLTESVLRHLCRITGENTTINSATTRVERIMVVVADRMATWMDETISAIEEQLNAQLEPTASTSGISIRSTISVQSTATESTTDKADAYSISDKPSLESECSDTDKGSLTDEKYTKGETTEESEAEETDKDESAEQESEKDDETEQSNESERHSVSEEESESDEKSELDKSTTEKSDVEEESESEAESAAEDESEKETATADESNAEDTTANEGSESEVEGEEKPGKETSDKDDGHWSKIPTAKSSITSLKEEMTLPTDILDLLKEDVSSLPKSKTTSDRHKTVKDIIDQRFEKLAKGKLEKSLDSLAKYNIDEAASVVANWVDMILSSADRVPIIPERQGSAFEIKTGEGSELEVCKLSSTTITNKIAVTRGLDPPIRKKKLPRTLSPMNIKTTEDWADWALGAAHVGEEWGKWLDNMLEEVEEKLVSKSHGQDRTSKDEKDMWKQWQKEKGREAQKWRAEKEKIQEEAYLWKKKLEKENINNSEKQRKVVDY